LRLRGGRMGEDSIRDIGPLWTFAAEVLQTADKVMLPLTSPSRYLLSFPKTYACRLYISIYRFRLPHHLANPYLEE
jgi:hypothetical protein